MTTATERITSPPTSPPSKRVKTDAASTMADSAHSNTVTKVDQAPPLLIKKLTEKAKLPTRGSAYAAGYDLYASRPTTVPARGKVLVDTDISMAVPAGTCTSSLYTSYSLQVLTSKQTVASLHAPAWQPRISSIPAQVLSMPITGVPSRCYCSTTPIPTSPFPRVTG